MRLGVIRPEDKRTLVVSHGVRGSTLGPEGVTQRVVIERIGLLDPDRLADPFDGYVVTAGLKGDEPEKIQAVGVPRLGRYNHPEKPLGFNLASGLMMPQGIVECSLNILNRIGPGIPAFGRTMRFAILRQ
jgi:hypothetical protein